MSVPGSTVVAKNAAAVKPEGIRVVAESAEPASCGQFHRWKSSWQ